MAKKEMNLKDLLKDMLDTEQYNDFTKGCKSVITSIDVTDVVENLSSDPIKVYDDLETMQKSYREEAEKLERELEKLTLQHSIETTLMIVNLAAESKEEDFINFINKTIVSRKMDFTQMRILMELRLSVQKSRSMGEDINVVEMAMKSLSRLQGLVEEL